jgi:hypothetical protein
VRAGVYHLTYDPGVGTPSGVIVAGVRAPHTWSELLALAEDYDADTTTQPDWIRQDGGVFDEAGDGEPVETTFGLAPGTHGAICLTGEWPNVEIHSSAPFEVAD